MKPPNAPGPSGSASKIPPNAQVEGTLTGEAGLRCQLAHRPRRHGWFAENTTEYTIEGPRSNPRPFFVEQRFTDALRWRHGQVTLRADSSNVRRAFVTAAVVLAATLPQAAGAGHRLGALNPPPFPPLAGGWSHAEINVVIGKQPHTLILDQGRVVTVTQGQLTLLEAGGIVVSVPLAPTTKIIVGGRPAQWSDLRRRMIAATMRIDGGAAVRVRAR
jgi:hypothetical protein